MTNLNSVEFDPFAGGPILLSTGVTDPQQEIWLAIEVGGSDASLAYNESVSMVIRGPLDVSVLEASLSDLVLRHEALRTTISTDGATLCVEANARAALGLCDLSSQPEGDREQQRKAVLRQTVLVPFDLVRGPLVRFQLIKLSTSEFDLVITAHHIICDGWSTGVMLSELPELYAARREGRPSKLAPAPKFSDYAIAELHAMHGEDAAAAEKYWLATLGTNPPTLDLPTDHPRPIELALNARREDWLLPLDLIDGLRGVAKKAGATLVSTVLAAVDAWLYRITGQVEFSIGMPAAGQAANGVPGLVGHCVNTLPVRVAIDPQAPFIEHVRAIKRTIIDSAEHQRLSFGGLLRKLEVPRDPGRIPLIPVLFNLDRLIPDVQFGDARASFVSNPREFERFEIFFNGTETDQGVILETTYNTVLFEHDTIMRWLSQLTHLLAEVVKAPETPIGALPVLPDEERTRLIDVWNRTDVPLPNAHSVLDLIGAQVVRSPHAVAVQDDRSSLTYTELDQRANHVARKLVELGVKPGDCVGVCVERGTRLLVALLGVWKAQAAYVPLDPAYPQTRLAFVLSDAQIRVLVTEHSLSDVIEEPAFARLWIDEEQAMSSEPLPCSIDASALAYVLHTSGSTGKPKGVQIEHRALINFLTSMASVPGLGQDDVLVAVTTLSFDIAGLELYLPLIVGARVVVASREVAMDGAALASLLKFVGATVLQATPATWRLLLEANWSGGSGFKALCGGEALPRELGNDLCQRVGSLWNLYGPTETTVWSTCSKVEIAEGPVTIGRPIANTTTYVLDSRGQPVPIGAVGELYIGGVGLARGYLNRPDLTAERFVPDPFSSAPGARMYRTGDLVRYDSEGRLFFERRNDGQVKVRGFRIELGEIETALDLHPSVRQSAVIVHEFSAGDTRLLAYVVAALGQTIDLTAIQEHLRARLPPYMLPQHMVVLDAMPLTANGKVDRKSLPIADIGRLSVDDYVEPRTQVEVKLVALWSEMLRVSRVGIRDSFFALGGHSMLAVRMLNRLRDLFNVEVPLRTIFRAQTIEELAAHVEAGLLLAQASGSSARHNAAATEEIEF